MKIHMIKSSKKKERIEIVLDKEIVLKINERSVKEGRTTDDIIEAAILNYIDVDSGRLSIKRAAAERFCSKPFNLTTSELKSLFC